MASCDTTNEYTLRSGKKLRGGQIHWMVFGSGDSSLVLDYETDIPMESKDELRQEVDLIWSEFKDDVVTNGFNSAAIRPVRYDSTGLFRRGQGYGFVFIRQDDGDWKCLDDDR